MKQRAATWIGFLMMGFAPATWGMLMVSIPSEKDTTIYNSPPGSNPLSNGAGQHLFAGRTGENNSFEIRRALLKFNVADAVPTGAVIENSILFLTVSMVPPPARAPLFREDQFTLHRALAEWSEGTSDPPGNEGPGALATPGDTTWEDRIYPEVPWGTPGGQFVAQSSATKAIGDMGTYAFMDPHLGTDVQLWLNQPEQNFGWFLLGDEGESADKTVRRFETREAGEDAAPILLITYSMVPEPGTLTLFGVGLLLVRIWRTGCLSPNPVGCNTRAVAEPVHIMG